MKKLMILAIAGLVAGSASASLSVDYTLMGGIDDADGGTFQAVQSLTVAKGDVVVMFAGTNKKPSVYSPVFSSTSAETFTAINSWTTETNPNPAAWMSYAVIDTAGTYDFLVTGNGTVADRNGIYLLSSNQGDVAFLDGDEATYAGLAGGASLTVNNSLGWTTNPLYGEIAVIGGASHLRIVSGDSVNLDADDTGSNQRFSASTNIASGTSYDIAWSFTNSDAIDRSSNGSFLAAGFAEVIPEPATLGLVAAFGAGILFIRRRFMI
ncbi:PEP-CTERM sorting domain-containing protein [Pontiella sulfatireligans]|uniref:PEP-CTERM protein-sorting domain-containing protein n=1 Tax=Pontiella sulfatireligans TaxID=2750658 RepID=A0A6C2USL6_9BACT|nr:PEP-CTERM sorting domain-containing protein [Pontiella sulfatireligans]VGO22943.1 hypothetical protein SCARR_05041 [Pontiella sulfatireligans]